MRVRLLILTEPEYSDLLKTLSFSTRSKSKAISDIANETLQVVTDAAVRTYIKDPESPKK